MSIFFCFFGEKLFLSLLSRIGTEGISQNLAALAQYHAPGYSPDSDVFIGE